ncbi:MAG: ABC transporter permease [Hyphomicrobiales bacterium]
MKAFLEGAAFLARRLFQALIVMLVILVIAFAVRQSLGDPLREIMGQAVPESERAELRHELGLDAPWPVQFARYLGNAATGDLGTSIIYKRPAVEVVLAKFPASFELVLGASLIAPVISAGRCLLRGAATKPRRQAHLELECARHFGAGVSHRHFPDHGVFGLARLATCVWSRDGRSRLLAEWPADPRWA